MALSGAVAKLLCPAILIENPQCVSKSFPDFWKEWGKIAKSV
jgi:3-phosphoshikimate 1-carboxyvinyltransferase